jgi:hypothetical protein
MECEFEMSMVNVCKMRNAFYPLCDEYIHANVHCRTLYMYSLLIPIRDFPSEGRTKWVRRYSNLAKVLMRTILPIPPGTYMYAR